MENLLIVNNSSSTVSIHAPELERIVEIKKNDSTPISKADYDLIKHRIGVLSDKLTIELAQVETSNETSGSEEKHEEDVVKSASRESIKKDLLDLKAKIKLEKNADKKAELKKQFNDLKLKLE